MTIEMDAAQIARRMQELGENVVRQMERRILRESAKVVAERAKEKAPRGRRGDKRAGHPGMLRKSIKVRSGPRSRVTQSVLVTVFAPYANVIEFGSSKDRSRTPQPYLRPAMDESKADTLDTFADQLRQMIAEASVRRG